MTIRVFLSGNQVLSIYFDSNKESQRWYYKLLKHQGFNSPDQQYRIGV